MIFFAAIVLRNAWLCDDAYISLRTVDNFVHGYGLTWNISERVQAYTHPLWIFLIIPFYAVTGEVYFTVMIISLALSIGAVAWFAAKISKSIAAAVLGVLILSLSEAFVDFSTSGLENPLTFFLLALFFYFYFKDEITPQRLFWLSLIASLAAVNRLDTILLYAPMLASAFWPIKSKKAVYSLILGFLPLIVWESFSLLYYGFPFPNTAYAKLSTGIARMDVWRQGIWYLIYSLRVDPITLVIILTSIIIASFSRKRNVIAPAIGIVLYLIYIVNIGGCFMSGRYLAAPLLVAVILLSQYRRPSSILLFLWTLMILVVGLTPPGSPVYAARSDKGEPSRIWHGIVRERDWYNPTHGLINYDRAAAQWPSHDWIDLGLDARAHAPTYLAHVAVGMVGFYAGPQTTILDVYAITDPLLARLPMNKNVRYRVGHFGRFVPVGYEQTLATGKNEIRDTYLKQYYDKLSMLIHGPIFSLPRLWEIVKFNLGRYDYLIDDYNSPHLLKVKIDDIDQPRPKGIIGFFTRNIVYYTQGLEVDLDSVSHAPRFEIGRDHYNGQSFDFMLAGQKVGSGMIPTAPGRPREVSTVVVSVPPLVVEKGYDAIIVYPKETAQGFYTLSHLRLLD